jgi:hypothetical protein
MTELSLAALGRYFSPNNTDWAPWPVRLARGTLAALALPGQVASGALTIKPSKPGVWTDEDEALSQLNYDAMIGRATDLAGLAVLGGFGRSPHGSVGSSGARLSGLPMDRSSRMARADQMGFRRNIDLYHGTGNTFDKFKAVPTNSGNLASPGVSSALDPAIANEFAMSRSLGNAQANPQVHKLWHRTDHPATLNLTGREKHHEVVATLRDAFDNGNDAVLLRNYTSPGGKSGDIIIVRDANQLRSPNAAFDPARRNSRDLLAGVAGGGLTLSALNGSYRDD